MAIIWLTGKSGAGKTTIVNELRSWIKPPFVNLDGDEMRDSISLGAGFSKKDRTEHNLKVARLAVVLEKQFPLVIVSVIAPIEKVRQQITEVCNPYWVYIKRTKKKRKGHFYEVPKGYFTLNHNKLSVRESVKKLYWYLVDLKIKELNEEQNS